MGGRPGCKKIMEYAHQKFFIPKLEKITKFCCGATDISRKQVQQKLIFVGVFVLLVVIRTFVKCKIKLLIKLSKNYTLFFPRSKCSQEIIRARGRSTDEARISIWPGLIKRPHFFLRRFSHITGGGGSGTDGNCPILKWFTGAVNCV